MAIKLEMDRMIYIHQILFRYEKGNSAICNNMNGTLGHYSR